MNRLEFRANGSARAILVSRFPRLFTPNELRRGSVTKSCFLSIFAIGSGFISFFGKKIARNFYEFSSYNRLKIVLICSTICITLFPTPKHAWDKRDPIPLVLFLPFYIFFFFRSRCVIYALVIFFVFTGIAACNQAKSLVSEVILPFIMGSLLGFLMLPQAM